VAQAPDTLAARVAGRRAIAAGVVELELKTSDGSTLPAFEPGAHIDVHLGGGLVRQYSLANFQPAPDSYTIAIGLADASRGGSRYMHDSVAVGDELQIGLPRNSFPLDPEAAGYAFIAGGIGITPILSMVRWCEMARKPWRLLYAARNRQRAAYVEELVALGGDRVRLHFDDEAGHVADLAGFLGRLRRDEHVYCCGPEPLMQVVATQTAAHPADRVRFERFSAPRSTNKRRQPCLPCPAQVERTRTANRRRQQHPRRPRTGRHRPSLCLPRRTVPQLRNRGVLRAARAS
jgi:ferredoxin-NADP reductase